MAMMPTPRCKYRFLIGCLLKVEKTVIIQKIQTASNAMRGILMLLENSILNDWFAIVRSPNRTAKTKQSPIIAERSQKIIKILQHRLRIFRRYFVKNALIKFRVRIISVLISVHARSIIFQMSLHIPVIHRQSHLKKFFTRGAISDSVFSFPSTAYLIMKRMR